MSEPLMEVILVYASIPVFTGVLFIFLYMIVRYHFRVSLVEEGKQALKRAVKKHKTTSGFSLPVYFLTLLFVVIMVVMAYIARKRES